MNQSNYPVTEINADKAHENYDRWQQEKFGNTLKKTKRLDDEAEELENKFDLITDFTSND
jgi:hypothetical protein